MIKEISKVEPMDLSIACNIGRNSRLIDMRIKTAGIVFGTVESVAKQYGIKIKDSGNRLIFSAPKDRLQVFIEKLHFSGVHHANLG